MKKSLITAFIVAFILTSFGYFYAAGPPTAPQISGVTEADVTPYADAVIAAASDPVVHDSDIGGTVQGYDEDTAKTDVEEALSVPWTMYSDKRKVHTSAPSVAYVRPGDKIWVDSNNYDPSGEGLSIDLEVMLTEDPNELITDQVDRDFSGASDWTNNDINSYDETTDLTITASAADQYCSLAGTEAPTTSGEWCVLEVDVANLVSTWYIYDADGTELIGTITANGTDQKFYYIADDSTGGIRITSVSATSSADFDNFSLHHLPWISLRDAAGNRYVNQFNEMKFDSTPDSDDSWAGPTAEFLAGEILSQWDLVYMSHDTGTPEIKKWDADLATYKFYKPIGVVIESGGIADEATGTVGILWGIGRNDGWTAFADNSDEGKTVYGTTTAGAMSDTAPATTGDVVCAVGVVFDDDEIQFNFGLCTSVEVP